MADVPLIGVVSALGWAPTRAAPKPTAPAQRRRGHRPAHLAPRSATILTGIVYLHSDTGLMSMIEPLAAGKPADSMDDRPPRRELRVIRGSRPEPGPQAGRLGRVLIVDDSAHSREVYQSYLTTVGYDALTASNAEEALLLAGVITPDVIVMDVVLPGMSGNIATQMLKLDPRTRRIPVILLTGYPERAIQGRALERGVDAFLTKPCLPDELERHVRRLIEKRRGL